MKRALACAVAILLGGSLTSVFSQAPDPQAPNPDRLYHIGPDSMPQDGVPKGEIRGPFTLPSQVYPGTQHTYWVYVPAQVPRGGAGQPHDFSGWPGVQGRPTEAFARRT